MEGKCVQECEKGPISSEGGELRGTKIQGKGERGDLEKKLRIKNRNKEGEKKDRWIKEERRIEKRKERRGESEVGEGGREGEDWKGRD